MLHHQSRLLDISCASHMQHHGLLPQHSWEASSEYIMQRDQGYIALGITFVEITKITNLIQQQHLSADTKIGNFESRVDPLIEMTMV